MKRKCLAVGIILLFIGVAVAPSINSSVVKASIDNDLVEVTSQVCGIQGFGNTTVKLTKEQYQNLEQYLVEFRARLNQTTSREEAVLIFKDAVVELNKYGLLPKGISVKRAQQLVTIGHQIQSVPMIGKKSQQISINHDCLFTAIFQDSIELNIFIIIARMLSYYGSYWNLWPLVLGYILLFIGYFKPLRFMNQIYQINSIDLFFSVGLDGIKRGQLDISKVNGFTGLKIVLDSQNGVSFYLGFALDIE
jgi:hypothetical protein